MDILYSFKELFKVASELWTTYSTEKIWCFYTEMGAGKTTLIHRICEILKVRDAVTSPTFAIINEYYSPIAGIIYHMDWYRIKSYEEAVEAGVEDCICSGNMCLIEWPEKVQTLLPENHFSIQIQIKDTEMRRIITNK